MRIGILTHYFKSLNYGGNLQAYALAEFLHSEGFDAEQICYDIFFKREKNFSLLSRLYRNVRHFPRFAANVFLKKFVLRKRFVLVQKKLENRNLCINNFNANMIRHSQISYGYTDISRANDIYEAFITGSDQVWHPYNFCPAYLLSFAKKDKKKISYAASIAKSKLTKEEIDRLVKSISDYTAVSVREEDSASLLRRFSTQNIACVVDPVFLLSPTQWESVAVPYPINKPYVFAYYLGDDVESRFYAEHFAKEKGLKLVSIPYLKGSYRKCDWNFGDDQLFDIGPEHFISLIKNASYVFTDSFHGTAFSILFEKKFLVFPREKKSYAMSNRIDSILNICHCPERFCNTDDKMNISYLNQVVENSVIEKTCLNEKISYSKTFLKDSLLNG